MAYSHPPSSLGLMSFEIDRHDTLQGNLTHFSRRHMHVPARRQRCAGMHSMKLGRMGQYLQITLSARGAIVQNGRCVVLLRLNVIGAKQPTSASEGALRRQSYS